MPEGNRAASPRLVRDVDLTTRRVIFTRAARNVNRSIAGVTKPSMKV
jgi:hypothetical protein